MVGWALSHLEDCTPVAFELDLPPDWWIHPVFHTSKLKCYIRSEEFLREVEPPPPVLVGDTLEYEVEGCNGLLDVHVCLLESSDFSFSLELHKYRREYKPRLGRPKRENGW